jgi:hypothetical protein
LLVKGELIVQEYTDSSTDWCLRSSVDRMCRALFLAAYITLVEAPMEPEPELEAKAPPQPAPITSIVPAVLKETDPSFVHGPPQTHVLPLVSTWFLPPSTNGDGRDVSDNG